MGRRTADGRSARVTVPQNTTINQGDFANIGGMLGFAARDTKTGSGETKDAILVIEPAEYETGQILTSDAFAVGSKVYWDDGNKRFTTTAAGNRFAGVVTSAKDAGNIIWFWFAGERTPFVQAALQADSAASDVETLKTDFNALLAKLRTAGLLAT